MSELLERLRAEAALRDRTEISKLLLWAALHIESQDEALSEARAEWEQESRERIKLENALQASKSNIEQALQTLQAAWCPPIELGRDLAPHINLMAGHGDPDYLRSNGNSIRHVDTRTTKPSAPRKAKA